MKQAAALAFAIAAFLPLLGCSDSEAIYDKDPFFRRAYHFSDNNSARIIDISKAFATRNGLEISVNPGQFRKGDFNVSLHNANLNVVATNVAQRGVITIQATSRGKPTPEQTTKAEAYVAAVKMHLGEPVEDE